MYISFEAIISRLAFGDSHNHDRITTFIPPFFASRLFTSPTQKPQRKKKGEKTKTYRISTRIQLIQKPLIPRIHAITQQRSHHIDQPLLASRFLFKAQKLVRRVRRQDGFQLLGRVVLNEGCPGPTARHGESVAGVLCYCVFIGGADEGDYEGLDGVEELCGVGRRCMLVLGFFL